MALGVGCAASYTDLKSRLIPDWLTTPALAFGVIFYLLWGVLGRDLVFASFGCIGAISAFVLGIVLFRLGFWHGGDVKLLTAFGALVPFRYAISNVPYPFPFTIFLNSAILAVPIVVFEIAKHRSIKVKKELPFGAVLTVGLIVGLLFGDIYMKLLGVA